MKRIISFITAAVLCLCLLSMTVFAASATVSLTGPESIQVGKTLKVTLNMNGSGIYGMSGKLSYDSSLLTLKDCTVNVDSNWDIEFNENNFVLYDGQGESPVNGKVKLITLNFKVLEAAEDKTVTVSLNNLVATDASNDIPLSDVSFSCKVKKASASTTEPTTEPTDPATEPTTAPTVAPTEEPTEAPTEPSSEPTEPAVLVPGMEDDGHCCLPWWLLILVAVVCLVIGYLVGKKTKKK